MNCTATWLAALVAEPMVTFLKMTWLVFSIFKAGDAPSPIMTASRLPLAEMKVTVLVVLVPGIFPSSMAG